MPQLYKNEYQAGRCDNKPRGRWENKCGMPRNEENRPPNLDYKVIGQIADGVEKMIMAWSHGEEREAYPRPSAIVYSEFESPMNTCRGLQKPIKSPLSEKSFQESAGWNHMYPIQIQEVPDGITAENLMNGHTSGTGISQVVKDTGTVREQGIHAEKTARETATYRYQEAKSTGSQEGPRSSKVVGNKPGKSGQVEDVSNTSSQSFYTGNGGPEVGGWSKEDNGIQSVSSKDLGLISEGSGASSDHNSLQRSSSHKCRGSRQRKSGDLDSLRSNSSGAAEQPLMSKRTTPNPNPESEIQSCAREEQPKVNEESSEAPHLPRVNIGACRVAGLLDIQSGLVIIDDEVLEKKLAALTTMPPTPLMEGKELTGDEKLKQCQDLQIALLECAMEYEIKTIELKIKLKSLQSTPRHSDDSRSNSSEKDQTHYSKNSRESQIVESMKKQVFKLQREKGAVTKEYMSLVKKERKFEVQKRNLDDALLRVNRLQRELVKKEQELLDCQLLEKHAQVKLQEAEALAKASTKRQEAPPGVEPAKLVALLPSLREWVKNLKKLQAWRTGLDNRQGGRTITGGTAPFKVKRFYNR